MTPIYRTNAAPMRQLPLAGYDVEHMAFLAELKRRKAQEDKHHG